jgi:hypothetical protein
MVEKPDSKEIITTEELLTPDVVQLERSIDFMDRKGTISK